MKIISAFRIFELLLSVVQLFSKIFKNWSKQNVHLDVDTGFKDLELNRLPGYVSSK